MVDPTQATCAVPTSSTHNAGFSTVSERLLAFATTESRHVSPPFSERADQIDRRGLGRDHTTTTSSPFASTAGSTFEEPGGETCTSGPQDAPPSGDTRIRMWDSSGFLQSAHATNTRPPLAATVGLVADAPTGARSKRRGTAHATASFDQVNQISFPR